MDFLRSLTPTHDISTNHDYTRDAFPAKTHQAAYTENARQSVPDMSIEALRALGVQTLDEWINTPTQEPSSSNPAPQNTTTTTKHTSPLSSTSATTPSVLAVPLGGPRTSEHVKQLYQLCQVRGLVPEFEYEKKGERWGAVLKVAGRVVEAQGSFASKMEGKEVCAREGCGIVEALPVRGAGGGDGDGAGADGLKRLQEENWVGMLLEYCNATSHPQPLYQDYRLSEQSFATTVTLPSHPSAPSIFGNQSNGYNTKKAAKSAAAMSAVLWLRSQSLLPPTGGPMRKKVKKSEEPSSMRVDGNGTVIPSTQRSENSGTTSTISDPSNPGSSQSTSYVTEVNALCTTLGLSLPSYELEQQGSTSLYSGCARFDTSVNVKGLYGGLGEVKEVFGRKRAKEECARLVVSVLKGVLEERMRELDMEMGL